MSEGTAVQTTEPAADGAAQGEEQRPQSTFQTVSGIIFRVVFMWMVMSWLRGGNKTNTGDNKTVATFASQNLFKTGDVLDMWVFVNEEEHFTDFTNMNTLYWHKTDLTYGAWYDGPNQDGTFTSNTTIVLSEKVQKNGSLFMHVYFTQEGFVPNKKLEGSYSEQYTFEAHKQLNKYKKRTIKKTQNLLTGKTETDPTLLKRAETHGNTEIISHWHPNITINLVADQTNWAKGSVPHPLDKLVKFDDEHKTYEPIIHLNDYWNLIRDFQPINETVKEVNFHITYQPISLFKLQMYASQSMQNQWFNVLGEDYNEESEQDKDSLKEAMVETNPYLLGLTVIVSIVHSIFEFLAFKNDIQFWKSRKTLEGLSVRSVVFGVFQSVIVLLYILDNDTNFVIRVSVFIGCLIDAWKITKVMSVKFDMEDKLFGFLPKLKFTDKSTYVQSDTKKYDQLAFKYLGMLLFPLLAAYAVYSLIYEEHKGVYSFILGMLYGFLLTFGFIMMTPQLFINYKLKSVAHLPWRMLTYKALNTFIDDIFAFVIKMPTMYRIGCFRDDIVFFIYLYQRYIYRVDPKRVNEFGTTGEDHEQVSSGEASNSTAAIANGDAQSDKKND
ncbi:putative lipid scramblase CLPTM1 [Styela clava]